MTMTTGKLRRQWPMRFALSLAISGVLLQPVAAQQMFGTPEAAVAALREALRKGDTKALLRIAGAEHRSLVTTGEPTVDKENYAESTVRLNTFNALKTVSDTERVLLVGAEAWPFPVPIVKGQQGWYFASERGEEELLNRRIGENELGALEVMAAYRDAQMLYASEDRDGDGVREYAQRLNSSPGKQDGLYWTADADKGEALSPWGPLIAASGINLETKTADEPYHGYRYRVLTRQGPAAAGGPHDYIINGNMVAGYGLLAFPDEPGVSGVMSFLVNRNGQIFQKPLGDETVKIAAAMTDFDPGEGWILVETEISK